MQHCTIKRGCVQSSYRLRVINSYGQLYHACGIYKLQLHDQYKEQFIFLSKHHVNVAVILEDSKNDERQKVIFAVRRANDLVIVEEYEYKKQEI